MAKDFNLESDLKLSVSNDTNIKANLDFGSELASNVGVDLNSEADHIIDSENTAQNVSKHWGTGAAALGAATFAAIGGVFSGVKPPEYGSESDIRTHINTEYDGARFLEGERRRESQRQIETANAASNGSEYADNCDPPFDYTGKTPEQVAEQTANQQGFRIVSPETEE